MSAAVKDVVAPFAPLSPVSLREIISALESVHEMSAEFWSQFSVYDFFAPIGVHWSFAEHVRHLTKSMTPLLPGLKLPKLALRAAFGSPTRDAMSYGAVTAAYDKALADGGTAGRFTPSAESAGGTAERLNAILDNHSEAVRSLTTSLAKWTDAQLDAYRLPHPLLGKLSVREMMFFTVHHNEHHVLVAQRRAGEVGR
jgi:DinB superfamily